MPNYVTMPQQRSRRPRDLRRATDALLLYWHARGVPAIPNLDGILPTMCFAWHAFSGNCRAGCEDGTAANANAADAESDPRLGEVAWDFALRAGA